MDTTGSLCKKLTALFEKSGIEVGATAVGAQGSVLCRYNVKDGWMFDE